MPELSAYNIEVALDRISPFAFTRERSSGDLLYCDYHIELDGNWSGRLGSGRGGVYRHHYVKGVGRTLTAANWNEPRDRYHGSGHLSIGSALRERLITEVLRLRGLRATIVPCEGVLVRSLRTLEARAVRAGATSSIARCTPADACMAALTVKPANFARIGNVVFALDYFDPTPQALGRLFLQIERYLRAPGERRPSDGAPRAIVEALDAAFHRCFAHFQAFGRIGLLWVTTAGNVTLDGRVLDLETPHFFGTPFVGRRVRCRAGDFDTTLPLGFEELGCAGTWRRFLDWLATRLEWLATAGVVAQPEARTFLRELSRGVRARFSQRHLVHNDAALEASAISNLDAVWNLSPRDRQRLKAFARDALRRSVYGDPITTRSFTRWRRLDPGPAPPTPTPFYFEAPAFLPCGVAPDGSRFAADLASLSAETEPRRLLGRLRRL